MISASAATPRDATFPAADGTALNSWYWPASSPRGVLLIAHGLGEHGGCYRHVAETLGPRLDLDVLAFDFRGHGRSPGRRGVVRRYEDLQGDLAGAFAWAGRERPGLPRFLLGHSNGGQVALHFAARSGEGLAGLILSNPCLRLALKVPRHKLLAGQILRRLAPGLTLSAGLPRTMMSLDPEHLAERAADTLRHDRTNASLFFGMVEGGAQMAASAAQIHPPTLILLGEADPIIDPGTTRDFFGRLGAEDKTLIAYPSMLHEPLNDPDRARVLDDLASWLDDRMPTRKD